MAGMPVMTRMCARRLLAHAGPFLYFVLNRVSGMLHVTML
jgi:hypothetical protein